MYTCSNFKGGKKKIGIPKGTQQKLQPKLVGHGVGTYQYDTSDEHGLCAMGCKQQFIDHVNIPM